MGKIVLLDELTINQIAAGEVIERPASVVKEMVENSIDAGATNINVEIKNGGISYIRITDNGKGIEYDDMEMAFERHATSKIRQADDLKLVKSMGFRGEALASIASIANVEMISKTADRQTGNRIVVEAGNVLEFEETACPVGTTITVQNLFFNTPVRYKFLKKDYTESGYIEDVITRLALVNPRISFKLVNSGKTIIQTSGSGDIKDVIYRIYGKDTASAILSVDYNYDDIHITGIVGKPEIARSNRSNQLFFVNKRYVKDKTLSTAAEQSFKGLLPIGKYGFIILNIEINPNKVDVNVHPAKLEVRFEEENKIFQAIYHSIKDTLLKAELIANTEKDTEEVEINKFSNLFRKVEKENFAKISKEEEIKAKFNKLLEELNVNKKIDLPNNNAIKEENIENNEQTENKEDIFENQVKTPKNSILEVAINNVNQGQSLDKEEIEENIEEIEDLENINETEQDDLVEEIFKKVNLENDILENENNDIENEDIKQELQQTENIEQDIDYDEMFKNIKTLKKEEKQDFKTMYEKIFGKNLDEEEIEEKSIPNKITEDNIISIFDNDEKYSVSKNYKFIGIVFKTYIIIEIDKEMYIIDQHAAHERIMYEKIKENFYSEDDKDSQLLLLPDIITLTHKEMDIAKDNISIFEKAGFILEEFGDNTIKLMGAPNVCIDLDTKELFLETLDEINTVARTAKQEIEEKFIATVACKAAVKAKMALDRQEVDSLMEQLLELPNPFTCPHGRPTAIRMNLNDIEKKFARRK